jgi:FdhD protein
MNLYQHPAVQVRGNRGIRIEDVIAREHTFQLYINDALFSRVVASLGLLEELGAGFVVCEGLADRVESVEVRGYEIRIYARVREERKKGIGSSGGLEMGEVIPRVHSDLTLPSDDVYRITSEIRSEVWEKTGGVHCSVLFCNSVLSVKSCDVGRHNTVDKVVGHALLRGLDRSRCILGCTGRQPGGMVAKAARAGIPIIISRAASTDRGIQIAEEAGITLVCFSRGDRYTIYTHPERIEGIEGDGEAKPL